MKYAIDETELARLEALAGKASTLPFDDMAADGWGYVVVDILPAVTSAVPALVAEIRRLREEVEAWEWFGECRSLILWRGPEDEMMEIFNASREAAHADR